MPGAECAECCPAGLTWRTTRLWRQPVRAGNRRPPRGAAVLAAAASRGSYSWCAGLPCIHPDCVSVF
eukprot:10985001-Lingulodinium_polyedra.AAC.1